MERWDGGIQEEPAVPVNSPSSSVSVNVGGNTSPSLLKKSQQSNKQKKSVRFSNAVTVKVVPRISQSIPPTTSFVTGTLLDPSSRTFRYILLFLLCAQTYGPNFTRFCPTILQDQILSTFGIKSENFYLGLIAIADVPALILILICGYFLDRRFTVGKWSMGFALGVVGGQLVFALGAFIKSLPVLLIGRVMFQTCAGGLYVAQSVSMARWLAGVEMGLAIGVALSTAELTMYFASWMLPVAAQDYGLAQSLLLGALMAVGSLSATVLASAMDAWGNDQLPKPPRGSIYIHAPQAYQVPPPPQAVVTTKFLTASMTSKSVNSTTTPMATPVTGVAHTPPQTPPKAIPTRPSTPNRPPLYVPPVRTNSPMSSSSSSSSETPSPPAPAALLHSNGSNTIDANTNTNTNTNTKTSTTNTITASLKFTTTADYVTTPSTYGSTNMDEDVDTRQVSGKQINEEGGHRQLLILLSLASLLILPGGVLTHNLNDFENILYVAAAAAPAVGWIIDRAGRPCIFLAVGTAAQLAVLLTSIFARLLYDYTDLIDDIVAIILGLTFSVIVCSVWTGIALLVPGGWGGIAFAGVTVVNTAAISLAPLFYAYMHGPMEVLIPTAVSTTVGLVLLCVLYSKRSILNMNAHDIRRVVGYTIDSDEKLPLMSNSL